MPPLSFFCRVILVLSLALPVGLFAQSTSPRFDVASIRQNTSSVVRWRIEFTPDGFIAEDASLADLLHEAWASDPLLQWAPLPPWTQATRFDIAARFDAALFPHATRVQRESMLQNLLIDRFGLHIHEESREFPLLALMVAVPHASLRESAADDLMHDPVDGHPVCYFAASRRGYANMQGCTLADLARRLSSHWDTGLDRVVVDRTGLADRYNLQLRWQVSEPASDPRASTDPQAAPTASDPDPAAPDLSTALRQQLGLKLTKSHCRLNVLVVDHIAMPTPN